MSPQGIGIALYAMLVLFEMFQRVPATTFSKINDKTIMKLWKTNAELTSELLANDFDLDLMTQFVAGSAEPAALRYVVEALVDVQEESGELPPEEVAEILAIHKTIIDSLHAAAKGRSSS